MPFPADSVVHDPPALPTPRTSSDSLDAATLLPSRADLFDRLDAQLPAVAEKPATLLLIGLLRKDDGWPTPGSTLTAVTALLAASVRGEDWIARSGPSEFALVLHGTEDVAETAATRLAAAIADSGIAGLSAAAGIATLSAGCSAAEIHRRANLCLTAARAAGTGHVIRYRGTR